MAMPNQPAFANAKGFFCGLGLCFLLALTPPPEARAQAAAPKPVAKVGELTLGLKEFSSQAAFMGMGAEPGQMLPELREAILDTLIRRGLIIIQAKKHKIALTKQEIEKEENLLRGGAEEETFDQTLALQGLEYDQWRDIVQQDLLARKTVGLLLAPKVTVATEEITAYYQENREEFRKPEQVLAVHVLLPGQELARQVLDRLKKGDDPSQVAGELGVDLPDGGRPSWLDRGHMPESFEQKVFSLKRGEWAGPLKTEYGFHLVLVKDKRPAREEPLAQAAPVIQKQIKENKLANMVQDWVTQLRAQTTVWVNLQFLADGRLSELGS